MERDDYEEEKVPETDEEEEAQLTTAWQEYLEAVAQGTMPEFLAAEKEKEKAGRRKGEEGRRKEKGRSTKEETEKGMSLKDF